jgi:hypothetical protein
MNSLTIKSVIAASALFISILAVGLWKNQKSFNKISQPPVIKDVENQTSEINLNYEKIIYTCEIGEEDKPSVQIAEVKDFNGNILGVAAHVYQPEEVHLFIEGAVPRWNYASVSAESNTEKIKIIYPPQKANTAKKWILLLNGEDFHLEKAVKNCSEVSDE